MSRQSTPILTLPILASGSITVHRFTTTAGAQAGAAANAIGVAQTTAASGDTIPVDVLGTTIVEAGGAFSKGDLVEADTDGKAVVRSAGAILGRALQDSAGDGAYVEIFLIPN